jgi:hypothetical protein
MVNTWYCTEPDKHENVAVVIPTGKGPVGASFDNSTSYPGTANRLVAAGKSLV